MKELEKKHKADKITCNLSAVLSLFLTAIGVLYFYNYGIDNDCGHTYLPMSVLVFSSLSIVIFIKSAKKLL